MIPIEQVISKLNSEQIKPVLDTEGAVLVIAGAGSGKTRVLTSRIAYLVQKMNVKPREIVAITFTNKAAGEMKERLSKLVDDADQMWISTIHSMCVRILRQNGYKLGFDNYFTIYDETDKDKALKRIVEELGFEPEKILKPAKNAISQAKNDCVLPSEFVDAYSDQNTRNNYAKTGYLSDIAKIYQAYDEYMAKSNSLDFDDLLFKTYLLFLHYPEVADYYANMFRYVHIDEFQDTNKVQFLLAKRLASIHNNIFVVGDDDQSIYGWRGAKIENILSFDKVYPHAKIYKLEQNYRSSKKILELANCIIANNTGRRQKVLWTENQDGTKIEYYVGNDENYEASYTAIQIKNLVSRGKSYKDFAVFMRLNALSRAYEQEFAKYGIPYRVFGGFRFFERKEIKDALSYLKLINNHRDNESFLRSIAFPKRGIGDKTLSSLLEFATAIGKSMFEAIDYLDASIISNSVKTKLVNYKNLILEFTEYSKLHAIGKLLQYVLDTTSFLEQFEEKTEENTSRLYNLSELKNSVEQFEQVNLDCSLSDYLNSVTLSSDTDDINSDDVVTLATIHSVKGLEFPVVFIGGLDENILPINRSGSDEEDLEEERRLMYVAVTRARERLYLTRAMSRYMYGRRERMFPSRFIKEGQAVLGTTNTYGVEKRERITDNYSRTDDYSRIDESNSSSGGYSSSYAKKYLSTNTLKEKSGVNYGAYKSGVKVNHAKFGQGVIITVKGAGDNVIVDVAFKGVGIKSLSVKYAPMEIING